MPPAHAFAELRGLLPYKAALVGSGCVSVDADYTGQIRPRCGYTSKRNRPRRGLLFVCQECYFTPHADPSGKGNICMRTLVVRQDWITTGKPVECPSRDQAMKPKRHAFPGMPNCGGVRPQASR